MSIRLATTIGKGIHCPPSPTTPTAVTAYSFRSHHSLGCLRSSHRGEQYSRRPSHSILQGYIQQILFKWSSWEGMPWNDPVHCVRCRLPDLLRFIVIHTVSIRLCRVVCSWLCELMAIRCGTTSDLYTTICVSGKTDSQTCSAEAWLLVGGMAMLLFFILGL